MLSLRIALRYFFSRKSHGAVNVISLISLAGVAVATMAMVCVLSVFNGFTDLALSRTSQIDPQLLVTPVQGKTFADGEGLAARIAQLPEVAVALPVVEETALAGYYGKQMPVRVKGVPEGYSAVVDVHPLYIDSIPPQLYTPPEGAALSVGTAVGLEARPDPYALLELYAPRREGRINPSAPMGAFRADSLAVTAVYQVEDQAADANHVIIPLSRARSLLGYTTEATAIEATPATGHSVDDARNAILAIMGDSAAVADRVMQQEAAFRMINIEKWVTFVMLAFIMVIAAFNIISTMAMLIIEKERDADTLRVLGASQNMVAGIFTAEGALITICGGIIGIIVGVALSLWQQCTGFIKMGGDHTVMIIDSYPVRVEWSDQLAVLLVVAAVALVTGLLARYMTPGASR
ncbi:MAG: ABC transporter permease [Candidatus Amulumruptor caecigallinarius]|nr:ABC transporter permease [Candidatus Amulumruptor caecigallinarius]MCM1396609.1 ABC transporter permease [Candidatus Amulumruptor caecigallinarius]MCM1453333.1 ABC transporter permease [bacterium]